MHTFSKEAHNQYKMRECSYYFATMISILLAICTLCSVPATSHVISIVNESSICVSSNSSSHLECSTLPYCFSRITECIQENTTLVFQPGIHSTASLSGLLKIQDIEDLNIQGENSIIQCYGQVGFMFRRVNRLHVRGLYFRNCGAILIPSIVQDLIPSQAHSNSQTFWNTSVAVVVADSHSVDLWQVSISKSRGYGMIAVNLLGKSRIHGVTISHSNYAAIERYKHDYDLCKIPENVGCSGGSIVLLYEMCYSCSPGPHQLVVSSMVAEYGVNLEQWDVGLGIEAAGGLTISPRQFTSYYITIVIQNSTFASNIGMHAGNAVVEMYTTNCLVTFINSSFLNGNTDLKYYADFSKSGGMYTIWGQLFEEEPFTKCLYIDNCTFAYNSGLFGGALFVSSLIDDEVVSVTTSRVDIRNCDVRNNCGYSGIIRLSASRTGESSVSVNYVSVILNNTRIYNNSLLHPSNQDTLIELNRFEYFSKSSLHATNQHDLNLVDITIADNQMRGLDVSWTKVFYFSGTNYITGNLADNGGAIQLFQSSFVVQLHSLLYITNNRARIYGGGIFIREEVTNNCFFYTHNITSILEPRILMQENKADLSGNSIFGGNIDNCQLEGMPATNGLDIFWELFDIPFSRSLTEVTSTVRQLCFCKEHKPGCDTKMMTISTFPGQGFSVSAVAVGQLNGTNQDTAVSHIIESQASITLGQQQGIQELLTVCTRLNYTLNSGENKVTIIGLQTNYGKTRLPNSLVLSLEVHTRSCPLGFSLDKEEMVCVCNEFLSRFDVKCFIGLDVEFQTQFPGWIGYNSEENLLLAHKSCPLQYCKSRSVNFTIEEADLQCQDGHSGIMCGGCRENLSLVFGSSACRECSNSYLSLLLAFFTAGLLLVAIMIYGDLTLSQGLFNGLIFYANIVRIHHSIFFPPDHTNIVTVFIAWLNLDLGIEVCFYNGMDSYARTWLQYLFPAYIWILVVAVIFAGWHSNHAARVFGKNAVQVLATMLLLSYTKIQRIVLETWSSTSVAHETGSFSVWLIDGNVPFMKGKHIWLSLMSIAITVVFLIPFTLILLCEYPLQAKLGTLMIRYKLTPFIDVYQGPYKIQFRWWSGAMLLVRVVLLLAFGFNTLGDQRLNLILIVSMSAIIMGVSWNVGTIYKEKYVNVLESFFLLNLALLSGWTLYNRYSSTQFFLYQTIVSYTFVGSSLLVFIALIGSRFYKKIFSKDKGRLSPPKCCTKQVQQTSINSYSESTPF